MNTKCLFFCVNLCLSPEVSGQVAAKFFYCFQSKTLRKNSTMGQEVDFSSEEAKVKNSMDRLNDHIQQMAGIFENFSKEELLHKPAPGKWSRLEILGHLIDSAINNLKRFTEIQFLPQPYKVISYKQDELVAVNQYQHLPLAHLLDLWAALNQQLIYVIKNIPKEKLNYPVGLPNDSKEVKSLSWIICDYVTHMEHHLKQL